MVLCHDAGRERVHGYESYAIQPVDELAGLYEELASAVAPSTVVAGALDTSDLDASGAEAALAEYADALGAPAVDPIRGDPGELLEAVA
jgi:uncharacterized NAD-dependent epimerase/dehydratase family protein